MEEIRKFQEEYPYWDKAKYKKLNGFDTPEDLERAQTIAIE